MKKIISIIITISIISCGVSSSYYQVLKTQVENGKLENNLVVFEDINCIVTYDLWKDGGNVGFNVFNKTDKILRIDLTKTFFVLNGVSYQYFQNRTFSNSTNSGTINTYNIPRYFPYTNAERVSSSISSTFSTTFIEKSEVSIPPNSSSNISEYKILDSRYVNCDLSKSPSLKEIKTLKFTKDISPYIFRNYITYYTSNDTVERENKFYVSEITNYPYDYMFEEIDTTFCGSKLDLPIDILKKGAANAFFIKYDVY